MLPSPQGALGTRRDSPVLGPPVTFQSRGLPWGQVQYTLSSTPGGFIHLLLPGKKGRKPESLSSQEAPQRPKDAGRAELERARTRLKEAPGRQGTGPGMAGHRQTLPNAPRGLTYKGLHLSAA